MKSNYRVSLYFNPLLNDEGTSMLKRAPFKYSENNITWDGHYYSVVSCKYEATEFIWECKNSRLPLIEDKKSIIPPITLLGSVVPPKAKEKS